MPIPGMPKAPLLLQRGFTCFLWQASAVVQTVLAASLYVCVNLWLLKSQLESVGQASEISKMLAIARMAINYLAVLSTIGSFKAKSLKLLRQMFAWFNHVQASTGLVGSHVLDCATGWGFPARYRASVLSPLPMVLLLSIASVAFQRFR